MLPSLGVRDLIMCWEGARRDEAGGRGILRRCAPAPRGRHNTKAEPGRWTFRLGGKMSCIADEAPPVATNGQLECAGR